MKSAGLSILVFLFVLAIVLLPGGFAVQYCLEHWFHKSVSLLVCIIAGLFTGELAVPAAIITWLLVVAGVIQ